MDADPRAPSAAAPPRRLKVLIVDDDPVILETLQAMLRASGHDATAADEGAAGIEAFRAAQARGAAFDVVMTDLGMPGVDGRAVAAAVKRLSPDVPVVLLTGWGEGADAQRDGHHDIDLVMAKPPQLRELRDALSRFGAR